MRDLESLRYRFGEGLPWSHWRTLPDGPEKYQSYLCSREWAERRNAVLERCDGTCERCGLHPAENVHHLTYIRKYAERPEDLAGLCRHCHEFTHGKSDFDPLGEKAEQRLRNRPVSGWKTAEHAGGEDSLVSCPECGDTNCHIKAISLDSRAQSARVELFCEGGHSWKLCLDDFARGEVRVWICGIECVADKEIA